LECVSCDQIAVSLIYQCDLAGRVSRRVEDEQRSDRVALGHGSSRRVALDVASAQFGWWFIREGFVVAGEQKGFAGADDDFGVGEAIAQRGERSSVVYVHVGENNPGDRQPRPLCGVEDGVCAAGEVCVDQCEAVVVAHQVAVEPSETRELNEVIAVA
jgi:hypothetical protein